MQAFTTPMMRQYATIKNEYQDCLLLYRMGDFYELFMDDAHIGAQVLNITLTSRPKGKDGRIPMAGVPYHAIDAYLAKLVRAGYKVAICEQVSLPNKYGIIDREVVRIVTPGTVLDEKALEKKENNYIVSIAIDGFTVGMSTADISTGDFYTQQFIGDSIEHAIVDELSRIAPVECILHESLYNNPEILKVLKKQKGMNIFCFNEWETYSLHAKQFLKKHFGLETLASFGLEDKPIGIQTAAALLGYLEHTQKTSLPHIQKITSVRDEEYMLVDRSSIINLELFTTIREGNVQGSLIQILDQTITAMGGRQLKQWIRKPLINKHAITKRHDAVEELQKDSIQEDIRSALKEIVDVERILSRLSVSIGNARDLVALGQALKKILLTKEILGKCKSKELIEIRKSISETLQQVIAIIEAHIVAEPPFSIKDGGIIATGVDTTLDDLRRIVATSKDWITQMEQAERKRTGIASLKVRFNKVFGFYIEISKGSLPLAPKEYMRKQTLVNGERFITPALKEHEERILTAEETIQEREYAIFVQVLAKVLEKTAMIQKAAQSIATLDCLQSFAYIATRYNYTRPTLLYSGEIRVKQGRHPVVERLLEDTQFVPNDIEINTTNQQLLLITGPNMAGKSVLIRQVALMNLMAQIGCFVPAKQAHLSLVDRIFVRSGASDVITSGLSTFMVEMVETAYILHNATPKSLIIMDEIGRGTSTYDGISIAWAVAEYIVTTTPIAAKTLFATHYHELQELAKQYPKKIKNFHMAIDNTKGHPIFLHTLLPGGASHSFGVAVAKLAGVPHPVISKAFEKLAQLEKQHAIEDHELQNNTAPTQIINHILEKEIEKLDIHQLTPLEALNTLAALKEKVKRIQTSSASSYLEMD